MKIPTFQTHRLCFPAEILNDHLLSSVDRLLIAFIISYDKHQGCYASNFKMSRFCNCSVGTISKSISKLLSLGYLRINDVDPNRGGRGFIRRVKLALQQECYAERSIVKASVVK